MAAMGYNYDRGSIRGRPKLDDHRVIADASSRHWGFHRWTLLMGIIVMAASSFNSPVKEMFDGESGLINK